VTRRTLSAGLGDTGPARSVPHFKHHFPSIPDLDRRGLARFVVRPHGVAAVAVGQAYALKPKPSTAGRTGAWPRRPKARLASGESRQGRPGERPHLPFHLLRLKHLSATVDSAAREPSLLWVPPPFSVGGSKIPAGPSRKHASQ